MIILHPGENIIKIVRRHWYVMVVGCASFTLMAIFPLLIVLVLVLWIEPAAAVINHHWPIILFLNAGWLLVLWVMCGVVWTNYYLDVLVITNKRIIDIEQIGLFARDEAEMRLDSLEDVSVEIVGIIPTLLRFGDLQMQTAGSQKEFVVHDVPDPVAIKNLIVDQYDKYVDQDVQVGGHKRKILT